MLWQSISTNDKLEEEYIDLVPILQNLYLDVDKFLNPIKAWRWQMVDVKQVADAADIHLTVSSSVCMCTPATVN